MRKNFLKVRVLLLEFVRKIAICCRSHILRIDLQSSNFNFLQKMNHAELTLFRNMFRGIFVPNPWELLHY
ncbi:hypothetical protein FH586_18985 [Leptospira weilii]|nr:hypothetical protein [Leptospira weilii]ULH28381.1 hypothetical protein FH586_18985 [Leptospira weilii]